MPSSGAGPSRRSHTKSRKGCKTCKRRHIRCDENFPQCRNCTKHQVTCDYMDTVGSDTESVHSPEQNPLSFSPGTESRIDQWQNTGSFPYPELHVYPPPSIEQYSKDDLRLLHHLTSVSDELRSKGTSGLTIWTEKMPKFLSIASSHQFVMHALLSFSANNLAWTRSSSETRNLSIHHGSLALRGLHDAIGNFSHLNADAVLAASLLLLWQATDWRSWSSLRAGIQTVLSQLQSWQHPSNFAEYINEEDLLMGTYRQHRRTSSLDPSERDSTIRNIVAALQRLQIALQGNEAEHYWTTQLLTYVLRLQTSAPARTPEDQFNHLYIVRKWLFWIPSLLLQGAGGQGPAMLTIAHFYSVALALEPLFPDLGSSFCARIALSPLESILSVTDAMQSQQMHQISFEIASLMQFPQQVAIHFRARTMSAHSRAPSDSSVLGVIPESLNYSVGNLSPAFAPAALHYTPASAPASQSSFLEVPVSQSGFTYGTQTWGAVPSPGFPPQSFTAEMDQVYSYGGIPSMEDFSGGTLDEESEAGPVYHYQQY